jgi:hypothetical protein
MSNWLSELGYKYINNVQVKSSIPSLPCSENFDNAFAAALRTFNTLSPRREIISGMAGLTNS